MTATRKDEPNPTLYQNERMIMESTLIATNTKAFLACTGLLALALADAALAPAPGSLEDLSFKGGGVALIVFLVRVILKSWEDHKNTLEKTVNANTEALHNVNTALINQTQFFDSIGRDAIHRAMNPQDTQLSASRNGEPPHHHE